jgi:radical SAM protein with 4Fe4S-binding SPASM domain
MMKKKIAVDFYPAFSEEEIIDYYLNPEFRSKSYSNFCLSPWICGYVFPDGNVKPCLNLDYNFGNIKESKFIEVWNSDAAKLFRKRLKEIKAYPACYRCTEFYRY